MLEVGGRDCRVERGCLVSPMGDTATTQHQRDRLDLASLQLLSSLLVSWHKFLFPDRKDPGVKVKMLEGQDLAELICLYTSHLSNSHQI